MNSSGFLRPSSPLCLTRLLANHQVALYTVHMFLLLSHDILILKDLEYVLVDVEHLLLVLRQRKTQSGSGNCH